MLISSDETGVYNVYRLNVQSGEKVALTASTTDSTFAVSGFPADGRVLFTADNGGDEISHVHVREESGETRDLTPEDNAASFFIGWSNDDRYFYIASNARDPQAFDVYRYRADTYEREMVFRNDDLYVVAAVDGDRYLALVESHSSTDSSVLIHDLQRAEGRPKVVTPHDEPAECNVYCFTPDWRHLVYGTNEHGEFREAWQFDIESGEREPFIRSEWDVSFVGYSRSGRYRVVTTNEDAKTRVAVYDDTNNRGEVTLPPLPAGDITAARFSRDEERLAILLSSDTSPADIYVVDFELGHGRRLTTSLNAAIDEDDLVAGDLVRYTSYDGLEIPGILFRPPQASAAAPCPALVWVHGGPADQSRSGYAPTLQHLINHGYAVFAANNRGSSGYGKTFLHMADRKQGEADLDDIVWAEKYLASLDWIDSNRIGIMGASFGGFMVGAALAFRPEVFSVGIDLFGAMNLLRTLKSIPPWFAMERKAIYDVMGDPATDEARLAKNFPALSCGEYQGASTRGSGCQRLTGVAAGKR